MTSNVLIELVLLVKSYYFVYNWQPLMGMKRERTVVSVSDEQKAEEWKKLMTDRERADQYKSQEQRKQEQMVRLFFYLFLDNLSLTQVFFE